MESHSVNIHKHFRYKKRYSFFHKDRSLRYDLTIVKNSDNHGEILKKFETYEIEIEILKYPSGIKQLFLQAIYNVYAVISNQRFLIDGKEITEIKNSFNSLCGITGKKSGIGPKPVTLEKKNCLIKSLGRVTILDDYTVTEKADGERAILYIDQNKKIYMIDDFMVYYTGIDIKSFKYTKTILDGEYIENKNIFAVFDIYYMNGKPVYNLPLIDDKKNNNSRITLMKEVVNKCKSKKEKTMNIIVKDFKYDSDIFKLSNDIYTNKHKYPYKIDGLIYTPKKYPVGGYYANDDGDISNKTWQRVFKWKPQLENTIDFYVEYGDIDNLYIYLKLYVADQINAQITAKKWIDTDTDQLKSDSGTNKVLFVPTEQLNEEFSTCKIAKNEYGKILCENGDKIADDSIVEFRYDKDWIPTRNRPVKTLNYRKNKIIAGNVNHMDTAKNVWNTICNPIDFSNIETMDEKVINDDVEKYYSRNVPRNKMASKNMIKYHNAIKNTLIQHVSQKYKTLVDIGCGKAGDLNKWKLYGIKKVFGIDNNKDNLENIKDGAYNRTLQSYYDNRFNYNINVVYLTMDAGQMIDKSYIESGMKDDDDKFVARVLWGYTKLSKENKKYHNFVKDKFGLVSCQFAIHYFFKNENTLDNFVANVDYFLSSGGYFFGTCLDGDKVLKLLKNIKKDDIIQKCAGEKDERIIWQIKKLYDDDNEINFGKKINVFMESIGRELNEYLVDFSLLKTKLAKRNITLANDIPNLSSKGNFSLFYEKYIEENKIVEDDKLTRNEKIYSDLNIYWIFKKNNI